MIDLSAEEMVDWANANMERVEELENTVGRLTAERDQARNARDIYVSEIERLTAESKAKDVAYETMQEYVTELERRCEAYEELLGQRVAKLKALEGEGAVRVGPNSTGITDDMIID